MSRTEVSAPLEPVPGAVRLHVLVQPTSSRSEAAGRHGERIKIRLALIALLADLLSVPGSAVTIKAGESSKSKTVIIAGVTLGEARTVLMA